MKYYKQDMPNHKTGYIKINDATKEIWHVQVNDETGTEFFRHGIYYTISDNNGNQLYHYRSTSFVDPNIPTVMNYMIMIWQWDKSDEITFARAAGAL